MIIIHFIMCQLYPIVIIKRSVDQTASCPLRNTHHAKEIRMRAHEQASVWRIPFGVGRAHADMGWPQQLQAWWAAHKTARQDVKLARLRARWDARREAVRVLHADAAADMVASAHACSTTTALCALAV